MKYALLDILEGLKRSDLWAFLAWNDIKKRYRRSTLGPFWITFATLIMVGGMTLVYGGLFRQEIKKFLPLVASGLVIWSLIAGCLTEGVNIFISASATIRQIPAPLTVHVFRLIWTQIIYFLHNLIAIVLALVIADVSVTPATLLVLPALAILIANLTWISLLLGATGARFRDVPLIVQSFMSAIFMITPIVWQPSFLPPDRQWVAYLNPFTYLVEIVREPLLGNSPSLAIWFVSIAMALGGGLITVIVYGRSRKKIAFWV
ncbi:ABC transporter permease [Microvirga sp. KLBC 81]|uniref:ABC transporter permease n=1 Tax=Microvirga sp. KLBC 81 TaxID=1862707 RepID=UPI000D50EA89|nr:ABC transporter permease [Microvirga sp. KLBC 81]PVE22120.1 ABC transporter permease [Microvirga sp. KLBC 81]